MVKNMNNSPFVFESPLHVEEVIECFRERWGVSYDLQLIVRKDCLYLQIMWAYLEQQSFPMSEESYINHLNEVVEIINRLGLSDQVRKWIRNVAPKPRIGRALSLKLRGDERLAEFLV
tara:strand:+ start:24 stop:377 length:354 start_codon:yes stop_codon:yes gene_type:complete